MIDPFRVATAALGLGHGRAGAGEEQVEAWGVLSANIEDGRYKST